MRRRRYGSSGATLGDAPSVKGDYHSKWEERIDQARQDRQKYEPTWHLCQSYFAGRQWVAWAARDRRIISLQDHPHWKHREQHTVNILTPYVHDLVGRVINEEIRPEVTWRRRDVESEKFAQQAKATWEWAWDEEIEAETKLAAAHTKCFVYGTAAIRCFYDRSKGASLGEVPVDPDGRPITDPMQARAYAEQMMMSGQNFKLQKVNEGANVWEPLSPFHLLVPPGIEYEWDFPWFAICRAMPVERVKMLFPKTAKNIKGEDLTSTEATGFRDTSPLGADPTANPGDLKDHVLLYTGYEMPCPDYPNGSVYVWTKNEELGYLGSLPYEIDGNYYSGVTFLHYNRVEGRFWSQGPVERGMGIQRQINRARSQAIEMKDRNLGRVYAYRGTITESNMPVGKINELIEVTPGYDFPQETQGIAPGVWIQAEAEISKMDLDRVLGTSEVQRGVAPQGVGAYSALALLAEQAERSTEHVVREARRAVQDLAKFTLYNIRRFWPSDKRVSITGPDGLMESFVFNAAQLPESVYVVWPAGAARPRSQAAEVQKTFDLFDRSVASGRPLPIDWLKESIDLGKTQPIPQLPGEAQQGKAELENMLLARGEMIMPAHYDDDLMHMQLHRAAQTAHSLLPGAEPLMQLFEMHIQAHVQAHQMKMMIAAQTGAMNMMIPGMGLTGLAGAGGGGMAQPGGPTGQQEPRFPGTEQTINQRGKLGPVASTQGPGAAE